MRMKARRRHDLQFQLPSQNFTLPPEDEVCVSLGSNLGNRLDSIQKGLDFLSTLQATDNSIEVSSIYETEPINCPEGSPLFLNTVCVMKCLLEPIDLLKNLKMFEEKIGRNLQAERNSPRPLDLDVIYFGSRVCDLPELILPHPRAHTRKFVLFPLAEIRPHTLFPGKNLTVVQLLETLDNAEKIRRVACKPV
jgi:2-amino-4-hydroxy-6-hydroxymethyldihydropteridine diphosphokinase